jgi:hypothetical protein
MKTIFLRVLEAENKAEALLEAVHSELRNVVFEVDASSFGSIPGSPFAYWISAAVRDTFVSVPPFATGERTAGVGVQTNDDFRFVRLWWETRPSNRGWCSMARGGRESAFFADVQTTVNWCLQGRELKASIEQRYGSASRHIQKEALYSSPGLTWPIRGARFRAGALPAGSIFSMAGKAAFAPANELPALLGIFNSRVFDYLLCVRAGKVGGVQYESGLIQAVPVPDNVEGPIGTMIARLARRAWSLRRSIDTRNETSHAFTFPAMLQVAGADVNIRAVAWSEQMSTIEAELAAIQAEIDECCFALYGINEADRRTIIEGFGPRVSEEVSSDGVNDTEDEGGEDVDEDESTADPTGLAAELASWAVGVAFGRFDLHVSTGARPIPNEPEPFDPLPACSPGMLTDDDGLSIPGPPACYPLTFTEAGVLVDDPGHTQDLSTAVRTVFDAVFSDDCDRWWHDMAALLDPKGDQLRGWLAGSFFEHHLKRHSKSRRKAPIFWQLGIPSGRYSVWLYAHRLTRDSFFQLQNEVVGPKLTHEERKLTSLMQNAGGSPSAAQRKEIAAHEIAIEELRTMLDEVKRVAPLWNPNLDDGVVLTMAPLWRLVPQCKPWQKELKAKWNELTEGKYDWAHIAMHLWPERVVPKCAADRSLAIAHGVENVFWVEGVDGKWKPHATPLRSVGELVRERSSPAVKEALKNLLDAPTTSENRRGRISRATSPART